MDWKVMEAKGGNGKRSARGRTVFSPLEKEALTYISPDDELIKLSQESVLPFLVVKFSVMKQGACEVVQGGSAHVCTCTWCEGACVCFQFLPT